MKLWDLLPDFMIAMEEQLKKDEERHGEKWKELPRSGQEKRIMQRIYTYNFEFEVKGKPIPWLKIAGLAFIAWIRDESQTTISVEEK